MHGTPQKVKVKTDPLAESATESQLISATSNSHDHLHDGHSEAATNADLSQNFKYAECTMWLHVYTCTLYMDTCTLYMACTPLFEPPNTNVHV